MKRCVKCGERKEDDEFAWRYKGLGIRQKACRECRKKENYQWYERHGETHRENVKNTLTSRREETRKFLYEYLSRHPCVDCGESDPLVLTFDHIKGKNKGIADMVRDGATLDEIMTEIQLCEVRCANCHMRKEKKRRGTRYWIF